MPRKVKRIPAAVIERCRQMFKDGCDWRAVHDMLLERGLRYKQFLRQADVIDYLATLLRLTCGGPLKIDYPQPLAELRYYDAVGVKILGVKILGSPGNDAYVNSEPSPTGWLVLPRILEEEVETANLSALRRGCPGAEATYLAACKKFGVPATQVYIEGFSPYLSRVAAPNEELSQLTQGMAYQWMLFWASFPKTGEKTLKHRKISPAAQRRLCHLDMALCRYRHRWRMWTWSCGREGWEGVWRVYEP